MVSPGNQTPKFLAESLVTVLTEYSELLGSVVLYLNCMITEVLYSGMVYSSFMCWTTTTFYSRCIAANLKTVCQPSHKIWLLFLVVTNCVV
jgi:hypothetical protein